MFLRNQHFCIGRVPYDPIDNGMVGALGGWGWWWWGGQGHAPPDIFCNLSTQKWSFLHSENKLSITLAQNVTSFSNRGLQILLPEEMVTLQN